MFLCTCEAMYIVYLPTGSHSYLSYGSFAICKQVVYMHYFLYVAVMCVMVDYFELYSCSFQTAVDQPEPQCLRQLFQQECRKGSYI